MEAGIMSQRANTGAHTRGKFRKHAVHAPRKTGGTRGIWNIEKQVDSLEKRPELRV